MRPAAPTAAAPARPQRAPGAADAHRTATASPSEVLTEPLLGDLEQAVGPCPARPLAAPASSLPASGLPAPAQPAEVLDRSLLRGLFQRARTVGSSTMPAFHWAGGAVGIGCVAAAMVLSTQKGSPPGEQAVVYSLAGAGTHLYLGGIEGLLRAAGRNGDRHSATAAATAGAALGGLFAAGALWTASAPALKGAGFALYALSIEGASRTLAAGYAGEPEVGEPRHLGRLTAYIGAGITSGCLLGASAVASGVIWKIGTFGISGNMVLAVTAGSHALLKCSLSMGSTLYGLFANPHAPAEAGQPSRLASLSLSAAEANV